MSKGKKNGASIFLDVLESEGAEFIFGNPGTTELPLMDALLTRPEVHYFWKPRNNRATFNGRVTYTP